MSGTVILGIGNPLAGDDAAGVYFVDLFSLRRQRARFPLPTDIAVLCAATAPESYTSVIRRQQPDLLILVDAADMGLLPGALRIIRPEAISTLSFSTHHMPLSMFMSYVRGFCGAVVLVGVQPEHTEMGKPLSEAVRKSIEGLAATILEGRIAEIPLLEQKS